MPDDDDDEIKEYRNSMSSIIDYIRKRRAIIRKRTKSLNTKNSTGFVELENINNGDFALPPDKLEFFYPASKNNVNWGYGKDHMATAASDDKKFLEEMFPVKLPDLDTYFEEREKIALFDKHFPLRFPALYYISKFLSNL